MVSLKAMGAALACVLFLASCAAETVDVGADQQTKGTIEEHPDRDTQDTANGHSVVSAFLSIASVDSDGEHATASGYFAPYQVEGETCLFTFEQSSRVVTRESSTVVNGNTSSCGIVTVPISELSRGTWSVTLENPSVEAGIVPGTATMEVP